jgi:hypothetical protein
MTDDPEDPSSGDPSEMPDLGGEPLSKREERIKGAQQAADEYRDHLDTRISKLPEDFLDKFAPRLEALTRIGPQDDVDDYVPKSSFRIERMSEGSIWIAAYTDDPTRPDIHYDVRCEDGGLYVTRRAEDSS